MLALHSVNKAVPLLIAILNAISHPIHRYGLVFHQGFMASLIVKQPYNAMCLLFIVLFYT
jgi:hypothetical protein